MSEHEIRWKEIGKRWELDSSLEKWFPFTAEELAQLRARVKELEDKLKNRNRNYDEILAAYIEQTKATNASAVKFTARIRELEELVQAMHPENAPKDGWPLMLYFGSESDRDEFISVCGQAIPGMWVTAIQKT